MNECEHFVDVPSILVSFLVCLPIFRTVIPISTSCTSSQIGVYDIHNQIWIALYIQTLAFVLGSNSVS